MITEIDLERLEQKIFDLIFIRDDNLIKKIEKLGESFDRNIQSLENSFSTLQNTLNKLMLTFLTGQEERHKELLQLTNIINDHENRISSLEICGYETKMLT